MSARAALTRLRSSGTAGTVLVPSASGVPEFQGPELRNAGSALPAGGSAAGGVRRERPFRGSASCSSGCSAPTVVVDGTWEQALSVALANPEFVVVTPDGDRLDGRGAWHAGGTAIGATPAAAEEARRKAAEAGEARDRAETALAEARTALEEARRWEAAGDKALDSHRARQAAVAAAADRLQTERAEAEAEAAALEEHAAALAAQAEAEVARRRAAGGARYPAARGRRGRRAPGGVGPPGGRRGPRGRDPGRGRRPAGARPAGGRRRGAPPGARQAARGGRGPARPPRRGPPAGRGAPGGPGAAGRRLRRHRPGHRRADRDRGSRVSTAGSATSAGNGRRPPGWPPPASTPSARSGPRPSGPSATPGSGGPGSRSKRPRSAPSSTPPSRPAGATWSANRRSPSPPRRPPARRARPCPPGARRLERELRLMGAINPLALEEYEAQKERYTLLESQLEDVKAARRDLAADHQAGQRGDRHPLRLGLRGHRAALRGPHRHPVPRRLGPAPARPSPKIR